MRRFGLSLGGVNAILAVCAVTLSTNPIPAFGQAAAVSRPDLIVYEGVGLGELRLGDPIQKIEQILGEADAGSEYYRKYHQIGLYIQLYEGKVYRLIFDKRFTGRLLTSELGMGDTLADLEWAYGPILERREVADHNAWRLDRILLVRKGGAQFKGGDASKLHYYDLGMYFYFDEQGRILRFGLSERTGYALRPPEERIPRNASRPGLPSGARGGRARPWQTWNRPDLSVHERVGFGDVEFGDPAARVEAFLGPPDAGSEAAWRYRELGITVAFDEGRASAFFFHEGHPSGSFYTGSFAGKLAASGVGIGDHLEDVEAFYGAVLERQRVQSLSKLAPSRVLLVCQGCTAYTTGNAARLYYRDLGLYFDFDDRERIVAFGVTQPPARARRIPSAKKLVGTVVPPFSLSTSQGRRVDHDSVRSHSAIVVYFYMLDCLPCGKALAALEHLALTNKDEDVRFVVIVQRGRDQQNQRELLAETVAGHMTMEWVIEDFDERRSGRLFQVIAYPTVFVIGRDKVIRAVVVGADDGFEASVRDGILAATRATE